MKVKIYALVDNTASSLCKAEHGLSYLVEYDKKILFDTGQTNLFIENGEILGVDFSEIDTIALSHGHYDHGNGLNYINNKKLVCHPDAFLERFSGKQQKPVGLNQSKDELSKKFEIIETTTPYWFSNNMVFLGEIPRLYTFEKVTTSFYLKNKQPDLLADDSAMAIKTKKGLFIISGCAHAGICNIIAHAQKVTGIIKVFGVIGGFHLKHNNKQTKETIAFLKTLKPELVMPSHCTEIAALGEFYKEFKGEQIKSGTLYTFSDVD